MSYPAGRSGQSEACTTGCCQFSGFSLADCLQTADQQLHVHPVQQLPICKPQSSCCTGRHCVFLQGGLLVDGPGTAKTTVTNKFLSRFSTEEALSNTATFPHLTAPQIFQISVEVTRAATHNLPASAECPWQLSLTVGAGNVHLRFAAAVAHARPPLIDSSALLGTTDGLQLP